MSKAFSFVVTQAVAASTTTTANPITLPSWAPHLARIIGLTIAAAESTSDAVAVTETGVTVQSALAPGYATLQGNAAILAGDPVAAQSVLTVDAVEIGEDTRPPAAFAGVGA